MLSISTVLNAETYEGFFNVQHSFAFSIHFGQLITFMLQDENTHLFLHFELEKLASLRNDLWFRNHLWFLNDLWFRYLIFKKMKQRSPKKNTVFYTLESLSCTRTSTQLIHPIFQVNSFWTTQMTAADNVKYALYFVQMKHRGWMPPRVCTCAYSFSYGQIF